MDARLIDEVWAFVAPMLIGGAAAPGPVGGAGSTILAAAAPIEIEHAAPVGPDLLVRGLVRDVERDSATRTA